MKDCVLILITSLLLFITCKVEKSPIAAEKKPDFPDEEYNPSWTYLGLSDKYVLRLRLFKPYFYACTGPDGLWRKNVTNDNSDWEYLGMSNDSLHWNSGLGLTDVVANEDNQDEILITYSTELLTEHHIFKTTNSGSTWFISDSGLGYQAPFPPPYDEEIYYVNPTIFCQTTNGLFAIGGKVCHTEDFGESWSILHGSPYVRDFKVHKNFQNILIGGGSGFFEEPFLFYSRNGGNSWDYSIIDTLNPGSVISIALDENNPELIYISMWEVIVRSNNFGVNWQEVYSSSEGIIRCVEEDISKTGRLFATDDYHLLETENYGTDWKQHESPNTEEIRIIIYDPDDKALYIGTLSGVAPYAGVYVYK